MAPVIVCGSVGSEEMRARVTQLYGVEPTIDFVQIAELVDNASVTASRER